MSASAHGNKKRLMSLPVDEFLRRLLLNLLPRGFVRMPTGTALRWPPASQRWTARTDRGSADFNPAPAPALWNRPVCGGTMHVGLLRLELEQELQGKLTDSRIAGTLNRAKGARIGGEIRVAEIRVVQDIEEFGVELETKAIAG
jgi:hypothetical protein